MSSSDANLITNWNNASSIINGYVIIGIYVVGLIGNLLNIFVLSQKTLRTSTSAILLLCSSIAGIIVLLSGCTSRIISNWTNELSDIYDWLCKFRNFVLYFGRTMVLCTITIATIDRWFSSSMHVNRRQKSSMKNILIGLAIVSFYSCIINIPIIFCYETNQVGTLLMCYGSTYSCRVSTDMIYAIGSILVPLTIMTIFSLLLVRNVRQMNNRIQHTSSSVSNQERKQPQHITPALQRRKKIDRQILIMLLVQVTLLFVLTIPQAVQKVYTSFNTVPSRRTLSGAIQNGIFSIFSCLSYIASAMPFYIYTLSGGSVFRNTFFDLMKNAYQKLLHRSR